MQLIPVACLSRDGTDSSLAAKVLGLFGLPMLLAASAQAQPTANSVQMHHTQLVLRGKLYRYTGAKYWYGGLVTTEGKAGQARLRKKLNFLQQHGIRNLRVMAGAWGVPGRVWLGIGPPGAG